MENEQLAQELGFINPKGIFKTLRVDNGDNLKGLNSTSEFVEKVKGEEGTERIKYGNTLYANIMATRAKLRKMDGENIEWYTKEFDPSLPNPITIIKQNSEAQLTYREIKEKFSKKNTNGGVRNDFTYIIVLYIKLKDEIMRLELTGTSRSKWFDYVNLLRAEGKYPFEVETELNIETDKEKGFNFCKFKKIKDIKVNRKELTELIKDIRTEKSIQLQEPKKEEDIEEIAIEDLPF